MNAYLRKEIRLLLPTFCIALVAALGIWLIPHNYETNISTLRKLMILLPIVVCPGLVVMAGLDSFGLEISSNTFSNLLSQPISRNQIWWTKVTLLAVSLLIVFGVWWFSFIFHLPEISWGAPHYIHNAFVIAWMILICSFSGGLWSVLLLRQVGAAFWFTVIVPSAIAVLTGYCTDKLGGGFSHERNIVIALAAYSIAGFFWARRMFFRAQDVAWTGGNIALPAWVRMPHVFSRSIKAQGRRPRLALLAKEFQLHQSSFVIAGILAILHLAVRFTAMAIPKVDDAWALKVLTEIFWGIWFIMPLLIGCTTVAEERKLGTLESQLCLPAKRRTQFVFKLVVGFVLAVFFAVIVPLIYEGGRILPDLHRSSLGMMGNEHDLQQFGKLGLVLFSLLEMCDPILPYIPALLFAVCFYCVAYYASTLGKNTLQAIAPAIFGIIIAWVLLIGPRILDDTWQQPLWRGWLIYIIGVPVLTVTLAWLAWWNFKRVLVERTIWMRNLFVLLTSLAVVMCVTTAIYQRAWEFFTQLEPTHGPARLTQVEGSTLRSDGMRTSVQFPDGRTWSTKFSWDGENIWSFVLGNWRLKEMFAGGQIVPGTNWQTVAFCALDVMALKSDGSLWVTEKSEDWSSWNPNATNTKPPEMAKFVRYGNATDWKSIHGGWMVVTAIKKDGTLWTIGTNKFNGDGVWPGARSFEPRRMGDDSDWAEVFGNAYSPAYRKTDGRVYVTAQQYLQKKEILKLDEINSVERAPYLEIHRKWHGVFIPSHPRLGMLHVGISDDGTLRFVGDYQHRMKPGDVGERDSQIGNETNWVGIIESAQHIVTLKADGTLWELELNDSDQPGLPAKDAKTTRIGSKSDWVGITTAVGGMVTLSADGGLWYWKFEAKYNQYSDGFRQLIRPSRRPQLVCNIFSAR